MRPRANWSNEGWRSGIERPIIGSSGPLYSSRIAKRVRLPSGTSENVRTPLKRPSGIPPVQVIPRPGSNAVTLTGKARLGFASDVTLSFSPGAIRPSSERTPEFQRV